MINFVTQKRILDVKGEKKVKYNARIVYRGTCTMQDVEERLINMSTLHPAEAHLAVDLVVDVLIKALCMGQIVDLGRLGRFKTSIKAKTVDNAEDVNADTVTDVTCIFKPSKEIKRALKNQHIQRERELSEKTKTEDFAISFYGKKQRAKHLLDKYTKLEEEYRKKGLLSADINPEN